MKMYLFSYYVSNTFFIKFHTNVNDVNKKIILIVDVFFNVFPPLTVKYFVEALWMDRYTK